MAGKEHRVTLRAPTVVFVFYGQHGSRGMWSFERTLFLLNGIKYLQKSTQICTSNRALSPVPRLRQIVATPETPPPGPLPATTPPKMTATLSFASVWTLYKWTHTSCTLLSVKLIILLHKPVVFPVSLLYGFPLGEYAIVYFLIFSWALVKCCCDPWDVVTTCTQSRGSI